MSDLGANLVLDHVDIHNCQAQTANTCQTSSNTELSELEYMAVQETRLMVRAEQLLLRRAGMTLQVRSVVQEKINHIHELVVRHEAITKEHETE